MKKVIISILCLFSIFSSILMVEAKEAVNINSDYAIVIDPDNDRVLYEKNAYEKMYPASMTKMVTIYLALQHIDDVNEKVVIEPYDLETLAETHASVAYFGLYEETTYLDLLYGAMLPSGADAVRALARLSSGDVESFVKEMNQWLKENGFSNTHFVNPTGIHDDDHYTTAYEMAKITQIVLQDERFREIFTTRSWTSNNGLHKWYSTTTSMASRYGLDTSFILGSKTGYTIEAQMCLASLIDVEGKELISIVGHGDRDKNGVTIEDTTLLKDYLADSYDLITIKKKDEILDQLEVKNTPETLDVTANHNIAVYLPKGYHKDEIEYHYLYDVEKAPIKKGEKIGSLEITYGNETIYKQDLKASKQIDKDMVGYLLQYVFRILPYIIGVIALFIILLLLVRKYIIHKRRKLRKRRLS